MLQRRDNLKGPDLAQVHRVQVPEEKAAESNDQHGQKLVESGQAMKRL